MKNGKIWGCPAPREDDMMRLEAELAQLRVEVEGLTRDWKEALADARRYHDGQLELARREGKLMGQLAQAQAVLTAAQAFVRRCRIARNTMRGEHLTVFPGETQEEAIAAHRKTWIAFEDAVDALG